MGKLFHPDSKFMAVLNRLGDLITLNLLWLVCCLPVFTIGPSTTALYTVLQKLEREEAPALAPAFFKAFRSSFRQALIVSLILLLPIALAGGYLFLLLSGALNNDTVLRFLCCLSIVIVSIVCSYAFPLLASFDNTVFGTLKNALLLPLSNPIIALAVAALTYLPFVVLVTNISFFLRMCVLWTLIGNAAAAFLNIKMLNLQFQRAVSRRDY